MKKFDIILLESFSRGELPMVGIQDLMRNMDWWGLLNLLISAASALLCITFHEMSHGRAACFLGDPTAKNAGRLSWNPIKHIDPLGLLMMVVARVGWAKPVPIDMRYFKKPRRDMALTALAGPASNLVLALVAVGLSSFLFHFPLRSLEAEPLGGTIGGTVWLVLLCFLANIAIRSMGLGLFNLIPISPLDGSKILFAFLPEKVYYTILRYERYVMLLVVVLTMTGVFSTPLSWLIYGGMQLLCTLTGCPLDLLLIVQDISFLF